MKSFHKHFETITEMEKFDREHTDGGCSSWGHATYATRQKFLNGDETYVAEAEAYLNRINDTLPETLRNEWHNDVFGPIVSVPDYLSNSPVPFRRERISESSCAPVRIIVSLTSSAGISAEVLRERGIVILALLMKVQQVRPIDLTVYCELDCDGHNTGMGIVSLNIESKPLSIGSALNAMANSDIARQMFYNCIGSESIIRGFKGGRGGWPETFTYGGKNIEYFKSVKELFKMTDGDLYIPPTYLTDPIVQNPLGWINENLQKLVHFEEV
jgi:hypothetical protein